MYAAISWRQPLYFLTALVLAGGLLMGCPTAPDGSAPFADFRANRLSGEAPLQVQFTDMSVGAANWYWDFGDGATSSERNPTHTYQHAGVYSVGLSVFNAAGSDTMARNNYITVNPQGGGGGGGGFAPTAAFTGTPRSGTAPLQVSFTDNSSDNGSSITARFWNFGDGNASTSRNPVHTYTQAGSYAVALTVTNAHGTTTRAEPGYITVTSSTPTMPPVAAFTGTPRSGTAPLQVQFSDQSTPGSAAITAWRWEFGDGGVSTQQHPKYTYAGAGTYTVSLRVTTAHGTRTETKQGYIVVTASTPTTPPVAAFTGTPRSGTAPLQVQFSDQSTPGSAAITAWRWEFGDGGVSTQQHPKYTYAGAGTFTVSLRVTTAHGTRTETKQGYIVVTASTPTTPPVAAFTGTPRSGTAPLQVQFSDQSTPGSAAITAWRWEFGDGGVSTQQHPKYTYTGAGTFTVSLRVTTAHGTRTETKQGYIVVSAGGGSQAEYDRGFEDGFAVDAEYWQGYDDSWDTRDGGPLYYSGSEIPYYDEISYRAGYWDGVWYAYNDGYFVAYDYAFTIGFSEGYDLAFYPDWYDFLLNDQHVEWLDGGFSDGYNDGFSEGRILGAVDYQEGLPFDWLDALLWYRAGNDAYIPSLDLGTGLYGPVYLYEWGTDPHDLVYKATPRVRNAQPRPPLSIRATLESKTAERGVSYRTLDEFTSEQLSVMPELSPRSAYPLQLQTTWLQRVQAYLTAMEAGKHSVSKRAAAQ